LPILTGSLVVIRPLYSQAGMLKLSVCESDKTGGDVSLVVGQLLYAGLVVVAAAARPVNLGATPDTTAVVTMSGVWRSEVKQNMQ